MTTGGVFEMEKEIVLAGAVRTAVGKFGGMLADVPASEMGAVVIREALKTRGRSVRTGRRSPDGLRAAGRAGAERCTPVRVTRRTSGACTGNDIEQCLRFRPEGCEYGGRPDRRGRRGCGGRGRDGEHVRRALALTAARFGYRMNNGELVDTMIKMRSRMRFTNIIWELRQRMWRNATGYRARRRMLCGLKPAKMRSGAEGRKICGRVVPVEIKRRKETVLFDTDEVPRDGVTAEGLAKLRPAFKK